MGGSRRLSVIDVGDAVEGCFSQIVLLLLPLLLALVSISLLRLEDHPADCFDSFVEGL